DPSAFSTLNLVFTASATSQQYRDFSSQWGFFQPSGRFRFLNHSLSELFGQSPRERLGWTPINAIAIANIGITTTGPSRSPPLLEICGGEPIPCYPYPLQLCGEGQQRPLLLFEIFAFLNQRSRIVLPGCNQSSTMILLWNPRKSRIGLGSHPGPGRFPPTGAPF